MLIDIAAAIGSIVISLLILLFVAQIIVTQRGGEPHYEELA